MEEFIGGGKYDLPQRVSALFNITYKNSTCSIGNNELINKNKYGVMVSKYMPQPWLDIPYRQ